MSAIQQLVAALGFTAPPGQQAYTAPGTYSWVCPAGVTSVSLVAVGGGGELVSSTGSGAGGGSLGYKNNISVTPGASYSVVVGVSGVFNGTKAGGNSSFDSVVYANGGSASGVGGTKPAATDGGGAGGTGGAWDGNVFGGAGGAGGYSGNGGNGGTAFGNGLSGAGGAAAGGAYQCTGGGVGIFGAGASGAGGANGGAAGSGGVAGSGTQLTGVGGSYGGGGNSGGAGTGAVRIIWPGNTRSFPSTNTADM